MKIELKQYGENFSWLLLENLTKVLVGFAVSVYVIRYLGPEDFGLISYALSVIGILTPFASLGLDAILFRNLIKDRDNEASLIYNVRILKLAASLSLTMVAIPVLYFYVDHGDFLYVISLFLIGLLIDVFALYREYYLSTEKVKYITISSVVSLAVSSALNVMFIFLKLHVIWFAAVYLVQKAINVISLRHYYNRESHNKKREFDLGLSKTMLQDSWPLIFTAFSGILYTSIDQVLIEYFLDIGQVGLYAAAVKLVMMFYIIPSILSNILYPKIIKLRELLTGDEFLQKMQILYFFNLLIAIFIFLFFAVFGEKVVLFLFGGDFLMSADVLYVYSFGLMFVFFGSMNNKLLMMDNMQKAMLSRNIFGLSVNVVLNLILIPRYGIVGGAISTIFSEFLIMLSYGLNSRVRYILTLQLKSFLFPLLVIKGFVK